MKLYNLGFNECGYKEILSDLKGMTRYNTKDPQKNTSTELRSRTEKYIKYFRKFFKMIQPIEKDLDKVKVSSFVKDNQEKGNWFMTSLTPIGLVNDYRDANGKEMV